MDLSKPETVGLANQRSQWVAVGIDYLESED